MVVNNAVVRELEELYCDQPSLVCPEFELLAFSRIKKYISKPMNYEDCLYAYFILVQELEELL